MFYYKAMANGPDFDPGSVRPDGEYEIDQERLQRDFALTERVQAGYTPFINEKGKE